MRRLALTMAIAGVLVLAGGTALAKDRGHHHRGPSHTARKHDRHHGYHKPYHYRSHPYHPRSRYYGTQIVIPYMVQRPPVVPYWGHPSVVYRPPPVYYSYPYYYGSQAVLSYQGRGFGISIGF